MTNLPVVIIMTNQSVAVDWSVCCNGWYMLAPCHWAPDIPEGGVGSAKGAVTCANPWLLVDVHSGLG